MRILITNDDGIHAPGILALAAGLRPDHDVSVIAPEHEQSAVGHAITLLHPLRVKRMAIMDGLEGFAVSGTPADCVKIGVAELMAEPPDLILSGINLGPNVGIDALYSGTVSAATEGAILGVPSVAVSLDTYTNPDFGPCVAFVRRLVDRIAMHPLPPHTALNVNVPALPPGRIRGVALTRHGRSRYQERFERRVDPRGNVYYWQTGDSRVRGVQEGTDLAALLDRKISITPVHFDLTDYEALESLSRNGFHKETM